MMASKQVSKAVILAAGRGARMKHLTEERPKPMVMVGDQPMLAHVLDSVEKVPIEDILLVVGYKQEIVRDYFAAHPRRNSRLSYCVQEQQDGTGSAALLAREFADGEPVLMTFGDILAPPETYRSLCSLQGAADAVLALKQVEDPCQGAAVYVEEDRIVKIIEKPPPGSSSTNWINAGIYCFGPAIFDELAKTPLSPRGEYELTGAIHQMLASGAVIRWAPIEGYWRDVGRPGDLAAAESDLSDRRQSER